MKFVMSPTNIYEEEYERHIKYEIFTYAAWFKKKKRYNSKNY